MNFKRTLNIFFVMAVAGTAHAEVIFSENFDSNYSNEDSVIDYNPPGTPIWVQWDPVDGNNANPDYAQIQNGTVKSGSQALGIADTDNRVIARLSGVNVTDTESSWRAWYKSEATSDFGFASITFRMDTGTKSFGLNTISGLAQWYDTSDSSKRVQTTWGAWDDIDVQIDLSDDTYAFYRNGSLAFSGGLGFNAAQINSWELDVTANDAATPTYAFYVDDLNIESIPEPATLGMMLAASMGLLGVRRFLAA